MTTREDWKFRAQYLRAAAKRMREEAPQLIASAESLEWQADICDFKAVAMHDAVGTSGHD